MGAPLQGSHHRQLQDSCISYKVWGDHKSLTITRFQQWTPIMKTLYIDSYKVPTVLCPCLQGLRDLIANFWYTTWGGCCGTFCPFHISFSICTMCICHLAFLTLGFHLTHLKMYLVSFKSSVKWSRYKRFIYSYTQMCIFKVSNLFRYICLLIHFIDLTLLWDHFTRINS